MKMNAGAEQVLIVVSASRPEAFKDSKVMVVGLGNTAADVATVLVGHAEKVYLSHRQGSIVVCKHVER